MENSNFEKEEIVMWNFLRNLFPYRAKSVDDFVKMVQQKGCRAVRVESYAVVVPQYSLEIAEGFIASRLGIIYLRYLVEFTSSTLQGHRISYRGPLFDFELFIIGYDDKEGDFEKATIKALWLTGQKVKGLRLALPGVVVEFIGPTGRSIDDIEYAYLCQEEKG